MLIKNNLIFILNTSLVKLNQQYLDKDIVRGAMAIICHCPFTIIRYFIPITDEL